MRQTNRDDTNMDDFTFAGGNQVTASGYGAFAYGDQVNVSSTVGTGFRSGVTVSATANNDYTVALGYRASNNGKAGTFVWGDQSTTDSVRNQANNEFRIRAAGGIRLRTSSAENSVVGSSSNAGCDLGAGSGSWSCWSSRTVKENVEDAEG